MKNNILGEKPVPQLLLKISVPSMVGMLITAVYNLVDAAFVSGLGMSHLGAISIMFPIGQLVAALGLLFGSGAGSYISRLLGQGCRQKASSVASITLSLSLSFGGVVIILISFFLKKILIFLGATCTILPFAMDYARIYIVSLIFNIFNVTMTNIVVSEGQSQVSVFANLFGAILNVILDPILIYFFEFGITGAAIATAISQLISSAIYIRFILSGKSQLRISYKSIKFEKEIIIEILKIGIPTFIFQVLTSVSTSLINIVAKPYGDSIIATMGAVSRVLTVGNLIVFGFTKGLQPIVGFNYSAKKINRLSEAIKIANIWTTAFCIGFAMILILFSKPIISVFSQNNYEVIEVGVKAIRANGISFLLFGYYSVYQTIFLALGKARQGTVIGISRQGLFFIPLICILPVFYGVDGIIFAQPIANVLASVLTVILSFSLHKDIRSCETNNMGNE